MHDRFADWLSFFSNESGQQSMAVFGGIVCKRDTGDPGGSSHEVGQAAQLIADGAGLDLAGPARDERNAMACVPDVRLLTAPVRIGAMSEARFVFRLPVGA